MNTRSWLALVSLGLLQLSAGQTPIYYCDKAGATVGINSTFAPEFLVVTAYPDGSGPASTCRFKVASPANGSLLRLEIEQNPSVPLQSRLEILDLTAANRVLAATDERSGSDRRVPLERTHLVTRPGSAISVTFTTFGTQTLPVKIRVRRFVNCPPGWRDLNGLCFSPLAANGTGGSGRLLDYATAQSACNAMRSNLLINYNRSFTLAQLYNVLGYQFDAWVGLTETGGPLRWLDGSYFGESTWPDGLRCASSVSWIGSNCFDYEQCAYFRVTNSPWAFYSGPVLDRCRHYGTERRFACVMPRNGTDTFYRVPNEPQYYIPPLHWLLPTVIGCVLLVALLFAALLRHRRRRYYAALVGTGDCTAQPILPPPGYDPRCPPQFDQHGRPVGWYGAAGQVQHPPQHQHHHGAYPPQYQQQPPPPQHQHCKQ